jgi:threonine dehydrogenase-like Zn-dependent dehydrogenase
VVEAVREPFAKHGLCHYAQPSVDGQTVSVCIVIGHDGGGELSSILSAQARDGSPQAVGSCITYLRRYGLMALAGVPAEDDDAESATNHGGNVTFRRPLPSPEDQARVLADTAKIKKATTMVELDALAEGFKATYAEHPGKEEVGAAWIKRKNEITSTTKGA